MSIRGRVTSSAIRLVARELERRYAAWLEISRPSVARLWDEQIRSVRTNFQNDPAPTDPRERT